MTSAMGESIGISKQRGFWLRCFLGGTLLAGSMMFACRAHAETLVCVTIPVHVTSVRGAVVDWNRNGIPGATVIITRNGVQIAKTKSDQAGHFRMKVAHGSYMMWVKAAGFTEADAVLRVGLNPKSALHGGEIYVPLVKSALYCGMTATTSRKVLRVETDYWNAVFANQE